MGDGWWASKARWSWQARHDMQGGHCRQTRNIDQSGK